MKEIKRRKHHSREYRQRAVELLLTGKSLTELAGDLGVAQSTLEGWKQRYLLDRSERPVDVEGIHPQIHCESRGSKCLSLL